MGFSQHYSALGLDLLHMPYAICPFLCISGVHTLNFKVLTMFNSLVNEWSMNLRRLHQLFWFFGQNCRHLAFCETLPCFFNFAMSLLFVPQNCSNPFYHSQGFNTFYWGQNVKIAKHLQGRSREHILSCPYYICNTFLPIIKDNLIRAQRTLGRTGQRPQIS